MPDDSTPDNAQETTEKRKPSVPGSPLRTARKAARGTSRGVTTARRGYRQTVTGITGGNSALMAEFTIGMAIVALRALADYVPNPDQSQPGTEQQRAGQAHPLTIVVAWIALFFVLSIAARSHTALQRPAVAFGGLMVLTLLVRSETELNTVAGWFAQRGTNKGTQTT